MLRLSTISWAVYLLCLAPGGCSKDTEETDSGVMSTNTSTLGEATTSGDTMEPTGGSEAAHELCDRYLACVAVITPEALPAAAQGFGEGGTCWQGSAGVAQQCADACQAGLAKDHELFPDEPKCYECTTDAECDTGAGEVCFQGNCTLCGNGVLDSVEICDDSPMCDVDCQGPAACSPLNAAGCDPPSACFLIVYTDQFNMSAMRMSCLDYSGEGENFVPPGASCEGDDLCASGGQCVLSMHLPPGACSTEACCAQYCDVADPDACDSGLTCKDLVSVLKYDVGYEFTDQGLDYLGLCVAP